MDLLGAAALFGAICVSCFFILSVWRQLRQASKMPPGPTPLPFIGNLLRVDRNNVSRSLIKVSPKTTSSHDPNPSLPSSATNCMSLMPIFHP